MSADYIIEAEGKEYQATENDVASKLNALDSLGHLDEGVVVRSPDSDEAVDSQNQQSDRVTDPKEGEVYLDPESNANWGSQNLVVDEVLDETAKEYEISVGNQQTTVAAENPGHPSDAQVVVGHYEGGSKQYAFPVTRLRELS